MIKDFVEGFKEGYENQRGSQPVNQHVNRPANQASAVGHGIKWFLITLVVTVVVGGLFAPIGILLATAGIAFLIFWGGSWAALTAGGYLLYGNDPDYQEYRRRGGSPFMDGMMFTETGNEYIVLPNPEPDYTTFNPPTNWCWQCDRCGARIEAPIGQCWYCGILFDPA